MYPQKFNIVKTHSMDPEDQEDAEGDEDEVVMEQQRRESVGPEGISILGTQMEQTQPHNVTRKRTLFSQTQNTLLDVSMASPALGLRRRSKNRLVTSTQRSDEQLDFFPSSQNSSTQHNNVPSGDVTDARTLGRISESSDSEIDFELPTKIIRRNGDPLVYCFFIWLINLQLQYYFFAKNVQFLYTED